jgi:uncharacterized membrane protein
MKIEIISLGLIIFSVIAIILGIVKLHTYPGRVAVKRNHPQKDAIDVTALLGLLLFPLWMLALIWAYSGAVIGSIYQPPEAEHKDASDQNKDSVPVVAAKG